MSTDNDPTSVPDQGAEQEHAASESLTPIAPLRLLAEDAEDLQIISAALQDAIMRPVDIRWERDARRLTVVLSRFCWECGGTRVMAAMQFGDVQAVKSRRLPRLPDQALELLAMDFYPTERVALFIDGANLYATAKALGFDIDYKRLLALFRHQGQLVRALYYTALVEDQEYSSIRPLIDWLDYNGYTMVTKPTKEFTDATGRRKIKGNMDIELAVDAMEIAPTIQCLYTRRPSGRMS